MIIGSCAIIGLGLIGGSLGLALQAKELTGCVWGVDINQENLDLAYAAGAIDRAASLKEAVEEADLVILAVPVGAVHALLKEMKPWLKHKAIVTDVCSTKESVTFWGKDIIGNRYIGGHPMTGAETSGFGSADPYLFENAFYLLTPDLDTDTEALNTLRSLVSSLGALLMEISAAEHDSIAAAISHLPHFMAASLVTAVAKMPVGKKAMALAAGGFRDTTRITAGSPIMWRDIFLSNRDQVLGTLRFMRSAMDELEDALKKSDGEEIYHILNEAGQVRKGLAINPKGYLPHIYEVVVTVPDKPGIIAGLSGMLGEAGINIVEIEILHAREGYEGTILVGFATLKEQEEAQKLFQEQQIKCRLRHG